MRHFLLAASLVTAAAMASSGSAARGLDDVKMSVARVLTVPEQPDKPGESGTAWKVAPGLYLTNRHVVAPALDDAGYKVYIIPSVAGADPIEVTVQASSPHDLALLAVDTTTPGAPLALASVSPEGGDPVYALGYPGQMDNVLKRDIRTAGPPDVTVGAEINSTDAPDETGAPLTRLVHSASVWPGNSGGPLLDKCLRVVGINEMVQTEDGGWAQKNVAIAAEPIRAFLRDNSVPPVVDDRRCSNGVLAQGSDPAIPAHTPAAAPPIRPDAFSGFGILLILMPLALAVCAGIVFLAQRGESSTKSVRPTGKREIW